MRVKPAQNYKSLKLASGSDLRLSSVTFFSSFFTEKTTFFSLTFKLTTISSSFPNANDVATPSSAF